MPFSQGAFSLPCSDDAEFLRSRPLRSPSQQAIAFDPLTDRLRGLGPSVLPDTERLAQLLREFSNTATGWLANLLPQYAGKWVRDRVTLRNEEQAIRPVRMNARNDLLHIDNFPSRPAAGRRILRLFVNIHVEDPRVWITSSLFPDLLRHYQRHSRIPTRSAMEWCGLPTGMKRLLNRDWSGRPAYDLFMLDLQHSLRRDDEFQERAPERFWNFAPGTCWLLFADGTSHAVLRGRYALEHSFFVPPHALVRPELSPLQQLVQAGASLRWRQAG